MEVIEAARAGDPSALERILQYYDRYINKICTRALYDKGVVSRILRKMVCRLCCE